MENELYTGTVSGVVSGLITSLVWVGIAFLFDKCRNRRLENSLRESLTPNDLSYFAGGEIGFQVQNNTGYDVRIRRVNLLGAGAFQTIQLAFRPDERDKGPQEDVHGWVEMPAFTTAAWSLSQATHRKLQEHLNTTIIGVQVIMEYQTLFGHKNIVKVSPRPRQWDWIARAFHEHIWGKRKSA